MRRNKRQKERDGSGYSGKKKRHTIKTQVVVDSKGAIKHISRSICGNVHDKKLFDQTKLVLPQNTKADLGYLGLPFDLPHKSSKLRKLTEREKKENKKHSSVRIIVEHVFASLKQFRILSQRFRNSLENYNDIFTIVCGLHNLRLA